MLVKEHLSSSWQHSTPSVLHVHQPCYCSRCCCWLDRHVLGGFGTWQLWRHYRPWLELDDYEHRRSPRDSSDPLHHHSKYIATTNHHSGFGVRATFGDFLDHSGYHCPTDHSPFLHDLLSPPDTLKRQNLLSLDIERNWIVRKAYCVPKLDLHYWQRRG